MMNASNIMPFKGQHPQIAPGAYVHPSAQVIGRVEIHEGASVWCDAVIRGDGNLISIGRGSNVQDLSCLHADPEGVGIPNAGPLVIGDNVTIGHRAILHGCRIENDCLVGMGAIIMNGAVLERHVLLGAGSLVGEGKRLEGGHLYLGAPARKVRPLTEAEMQVFALGAAEYQHLLPEYLQQAR